MIRTVERYVLLELLRTFALVILVMTFIFFLGTAFRLIKDELTYWQILRSLPYAVPYTLPYSLPMAFLIAVRKKAPSSGMSGVASTSMRWSSRVVQKAWSAGWRRPW